ncbi:exported hypothetical protein [Mesorhizobium metallidurans STM 2683]|uniref:Cytochrome c domain-containing protein n=1 Tax=Mesorhizobium metallidurans STM 2683 TaxID=1297569 RepID=M5EL35_9HYPH|nr:exported hypothetical protein [Mesorhizobium metallidurans STM 2683]
MKFFATMLTAAAMLFAAAPFASAQEDEAKPSAMADAAKGLAERDKIQAVFSHPRCAGCHVADDRPRWSGAHYGGTRVHAFNVQRGADGSGFGNPGLRCTACLSPAIPMRCMGLPAPRSGIWRRSRWPGSDSPRRKSVPGSRIPPAMAAAASGMSRCMSATTG